MALIKCEECGQMISDKAVKCPKCGAPIVKESVVPAQQTTVQQPQAEQRQPNPQQQPEKQENNKKPIIILLSIVLIAIVASIGLYFLLRNNTAESQKEFISTSSGTINGHEYVDLGLSVMWATCNVGASTPEDYGDYFAWGETKTKSTYNIDNCSTWGKNIGDIVGNSNYDAARANWGSTWRLPTKAEIQELINKCKWTWTKQGGHKGYKITGPNGNSIFLPAAGFRCGTSRDHAGKLGNYWSSSPYEGNINCAYDFIFDSGCFDWHWFARCIGYGVRPVSDGSTTPKETKTTSSSELSTTNGIINGHEYVDLGLSVKWATCNVGASSSSDYGNYYAWGETKTKSTYTENNCTTYNKSMGDISGNPNYDAARANWGGSWRLPTKKEIDELYNCKWTWYTQGGHDGYKITGPNGNSIFLPTAGERIGSSFYDASENGGYCYWSSSPVEGSTQKSYGLYESIEEDYGWTRYEGLSVRPVSDGTTTPKETKAILSSELSTTSGKINGYDYVDLGLSVKWATCNVGASSPSDYGNYYAWGETRTKSAYEEENYTTNKNLRNIAGNPNYDVARANWGGTWRIPTKKEIEELRDKCNWTWTTQGEHKGLIITGPNGNSIFLPAAGKCIGSEIDKAEEFGYYWISSYSDWPDFLFLCSSSLDKSRDCGFAGQSVRPVSD